MNDTFNFKRFGKYLGADLVSAASKYGLTLLVASFSGVIVYLFSLIFRLVHLTQAGTYTSDLAETLFAFAAIFLICSMPAALYGHITDKRSGSAYLMLPASTLEKFLSMVLICLIIVPVIFVTIFSVSDAIIALVDKYYSGTSLNIFNAGTIDLATDTTEVSSPMIFGLFTLITAFLLGALFFKKHKIAYTILAIFVISTVLMLIFGTIAASFFNGADESTIESFVYGTIDIFDTISWVFNLWNVILLAALLVVVYFRVRKIQH